jgi:hypothetical protein
MSALTLKADIHFAAAAANEKGPEGLPGLRHFD